VEHFFFVLKILVDSSSGNTASVGNFLVRDAGVTFFGEEREGFRQYLDSPLMMIDRGSHALPSVYSTPFFVFGKLVQFYDGDSFW